ncbi:hypothetical protein GCM10027089_27070 [Nocardia thraciensis]
MQAPCAASLAAAAYAVGLVSVTDTAVAIATVWVLLVSLPPPARCRRCWR